MSLCKGINAMRYFGGKARIANKIVPIIKAERCGLYVEPFVGGCNTFCKFDNPKLGLDIVPELIELWKSLQNGWRPPKVVTPEMYQQAKDGLITGQKEHSLGLGVRLAANGSVGTLKAKIVTTLKMHIIH